PTLLPTSDANQIRACLSFKNKFNQIRPLGSESLAYGRFDLFRFLDPRRWHPHGLRHAGELQFRFGKVEAERKLMLGNAAFFPVSGNIKLQQTIRVVVTNDELGANLVAGSGPERLDCVHRPTIAGEPEHGLAGI